MKLYGIFAIEAEATYCMDIMQEDYDKYVSENPAFDPESTLDRMDLWNHMKDELNYYDEPVDSVDVAGYLQEVEIA
jgi:hypothetical protein